MAHRQVDFKALGSTDFDHKAWINAALAACPANEPIEAVNIKLQQTIYDVGGVIDEKSSACVLRIPRAIQEIEALTKDVIALQDIAQGFETKLSSLESGTEDSIHTLSVLDSVKTKMQSVITLLGEAEKYKHLLFSVNNLFGSGDMVEIANCIHEMQRSSKMLEGVPTFENVKQQQQQHKEKLESLVKPGLLKALESRDIDKTISYANILKQIKSNISITDLYFSTRLPPLVALWEQRPFDKKGPIAALEKSIVDWLPRFYDSIQLESTIEKDWSEQLFESSHVILATLMTKLWEKIAPELQQLLGFLSLPSLIRLFSFTKDFSESLNLGDGIELEGVTQKVKQQFFLPFVPFQLNYVSMKRKSIEPQLKKIVPVERDFMSIILSVDNSMSPLFLLLESAVNECIQFTDGTEGEALVGLCEETLLDYLSKVLSIQKKLCEMASLLDVVYDQQNESMLYRTLHGSGKSTFAARTSHSLHRSASTPTPKPMQTTTSTTMAPQHNQDEHHEWTESYFEGALEWLELIDKLSRRTSLFEANLRNSLIGQTEAIFYSSEPKRLKCFHVTDKVRSEKLIGFFTERLTDVSKRLIPSVHDTIRKLHVSSQTFVFESMMSYVREKLCPLPNYESWGFAPTTQISAFSLTPQGYVKLIVEHLLVLCQLLEPHDSKSALLIFAHKENEEEESEETKESGFARQWITAAAMGTMELYLEKIAEIPTLSNHGASQLAVDIAHFFNVLKVLGIEPTIDLQHILNWTKKTEAEARTALQELDPDQKLDVASAMILQKRQIHADIQQASITD